MEQDCIFCKIVAGDMPAYKIYEDEHVMAFLNIYPSVKGHALVIPKKHGETIFDVDTDVLKHLMRGVEQTTRRLQNVLNPDGFNSGWNHGEQAGQSVPHMHVHIMPRWNGDGGGSIQSFIKNPGDMDVKEIFGLFVKS